MPKKLGSFEINSEIVSPEKYKEIYEKDKNNIGKTWIMPPVLGVSGNFGFIKVFYRTPIFRVFPTKKATVYGGRPRK